MNIEEKPFESLALGLNRDLSGLLLPKANEPNRGTFSGVFPLLGPNVTLGMRSQYSKVAAQEPLESLSDRFAQQIAIFPISKQVVINEFGAYVPQALFGLETQITYRQLANPDGTLNVTIHPKESTPTIDESFLSGDSEELIMFKSSTKPDQPNAYPLRGEAIEYDQPTQPIGVEDWDVLK